MSKKIKINIKDYEKLEFFIEEDASKGDFICLHDVNEINLEDTKTFFNKLVAEEREKLKQEIIIKEKQNIINEFKTGHEYLQLQNDLVKANNKYNELKVQQDLQLKLKVEETAKQFADEINNLKTTLQTQKLEAQNEMKDKVSE